MITVLLISIATAAVVRFVAWLMNAAEVVAIGAILVALVASVIVMNRKG